MTFTYRRSSKLLCPMSGLLAYCFWRAASNAVTIHLVFTLPQIAMLSLNFPSLPIALPFRVEAPPQPDSVMSSKKHKLGRLVARSWENILVAKHMHSVSTSVHTFQYDGVSMSTPIRARSAATSEKQLKLYIFHQLLDTYKYIYRRKRDNLYKAGKWTFTPTVTVTTTARTQRSDRALPPMDPLTAFSLACGVIQVVDFSLKALTKFKEIHDHGALSEYQDLEEITQHLTNLQTDLSLPQSSGITQAPYDRGLVELATRCSATAAQLIAKLHKLRIEGPHKKRQAIVKTVKAFREKREIQDIQKRLDGYRNSLDSRILINLRFVRVSHLQRLDQYLRSCHE